MGNKKRKNRKSAEKETSKISKFKIKELKREVGEHRERLLRLQAEFENYKKQLDKEREGFMKNANESLIKDLLVILDDFERAVGEIKKQHQVDKKLVQGIELIYKNFCKILKQRGLKKIDSLEKKFDPYYHEALLQEESTKEERVILEELQKGYLLNNKVIRHSKVKVSKKKN